MSILTRLSLVLVLLPALAWADIIPDDEEITWQPGYTFNGGKPSYSGTVDATDYGVQCDNSNDDTSEIQAALNAADATSANVELPSGTCKISSSLTITSSLRLVGQGPETTIITSSSTSGHVINAYGSGSSNTQNIAGTATKGSTTLSMSSVSGFAVSDMVIVSQQNDSSFVDSGVGTGGTWCGSSGDYTMNQVNIISAIAGTELTMLRENFYAWESTFSPRVARISTKTGYITPAIEELKIVRTATGGGDANAEAHINLMRTYQASVKNVWLKDPNGSHVRLNLSLMAEITGVYMDRATAVNSGRGYGINVFNWNSDHYIYNNIGTHLRHSFITECGGSGNVFAYNYSDSPVGNIGDQALFTDFSHHGIHAFMNLWEGNQGSHFSPDNTHGSGSHNTALRNIFTGYSDPDNESTITGGRRAVEIHEYNYYTHVIGNILGTDSYDGSWDYYRDGSTRAWGDIYVISTGYSSDGDSTRDGTNAWDLGIYHGNYNYYDDTIKWDESNQSIADQNIPDSYYLSAAPSFFSANNYTWPWVTPDEATKLYKLPAKERFDAGTYFTEVEQSASPATYHNVFKGGSFKGGSMK